MLLKQSYFFQIALDSNNTVLQNTNYYFVCLLSDYVLLLLIIGFMVFNATFNNISVISWRSVLLVEETEVSGKKHRPAASH